jgi:hypothetical protein
MNLARAVPGTSLESTDAGLYRGGDQNTFAPRPGRFLAPWARSDAPGYFCGGSAKVRRTPCSYMPAGRNRRRRETDFACCPIG